MEGAVDFEISQAFPFPILAEVNARTVTSEISFYVLSQAPCFGMAAVR